MDSLGMALGDTEAGDAGAGDADVGDTEAGDEGAEREWVRAHRALSRLARQRARADAEEGRWLLRARRSAAHVHMGFGTFAEYVERLFGYCARSTHEKLRVAEALEHLPVLAEGLESATLCWSALRELTRVATPETESAWLEVARGKLSRQLEPLVAGVRPGDLPSAARSPEARRHVLRFEVSAETYAAFRESVVQLRRASDASLDDDAVLLAMARAVLGGPRDDGRASYQVSLCVCPECGRGTQAAGGAIVPVGPAIVTMAACDAQQIGYVSESAHVGIDDAGRNATLDECVTLDDGSRAATDAIVPIVPNLVPVASDSAADLDNDRSRGAVPGDMRVPLDDIGPLDEPVPLANPVPPDSIIHLDREALPSMARFDRTAPCPHGHPSDANNSSRPAPTRPASRSPLLPGAGLPELGLP